MKKIFITICLFFLSASGSYAKTTEEIWYTYNGYSSFHNFQLQYPSDWKPKTISETLQAFAQTEDLEQGNYKLLIREFEGKSLEEAKNYYLDSQIVFVEEKEEIFESSQQKLLSNVVTYKNQTDQSQFQVVFIQRGTLIVSLFSADAESAEKIQTIYKTFQFSDNWLSYYDEVSGYYFIYPADFALSELENGIQLHDSNNPQETIFEVLKFANVGLQESIDITENGDLSLSSSKEIFLNGKVATEAVFLDGSIGKSLSYIFLENSGSTHRLSNLNVEKNFPVSDYFNEFLQEILTGFRFTKVKSVAGSSPFNNLSDVSKAHPNSEAINYLFEKKIINGYPDGTFKPDNPINRAELTKLVVATKLIPSLETYRNCFPDVKKEWFAPYICYAKEQGWVNGYADAKFKPSNNISRVEAIKIILLALYDQPLSDKGTLKSKTPLDVDLSAWYAKYFIFAENSKLLDKAHVKKSKDSYYYYPNDNMTRKEVAQAINNLIKFFP